MRKKMLTLTLALMLLLGAARAEGYEQWLSQKAFSMMERLEELAGDDIYIALFFPTLTDQKIEFEARIKRMWAVYAPADKEELLRQTGLPAQTEIDERLLRRLIWAGPSLLINPDVSSFGFQELVLFNVLRESECFSMPEGFRPTLVMIDTGADTCAIMSVSQAGEEIVAVNIMAVPGWMLTEGYWTTLDMETGRLLPIR